ncbi:GNAT family N-acetyltransferase [Thiomicrorhabdus indica]|uniref:bifunctional acetate--CoA ligase family protein/GNAT family N-acetyltransferase n=1 Tax=Thiomicrorhabdus indica TaxID=2267253 RepID=UPI00102DAA30|nr:GNAT family N-acetyltransferase [Thiomicrorhabdus indica]
MGPHYLSQFFNPKSIAVVGASNREDSVGATAFANLLTAGYQGDLFAINPKHSEVQSKPCFPSLSELYEQQNTKVELVVIATPATTALKLIEECGQLKIPNVIILSAGFESDDQANLRQRLLNTAHKHKIRILGPNCLGIIRPSINMNATFSKNQARAGHLALVSQSGALCTGILDWAETHDIGFSLVASSGDALDLDFGEILDYLATDSKTHSILLYIEGIKDARRFLSGLRKAARMKPVILLKSGRMPEGTQAAISHTGALVGKDDIFNAAIERAGVVRALTINQLFSAAKTLSYDLNIRQKRLAIVTNGGGPGVMATDLAAELGISMPDVSDKTKLALDETLPKHWSHHNPIDILGDANPERYQKAIKVCLEDPEYDAVLVLLTPQAMTNPTEIAKSIVELNDKNNPKHKPILTTWLGHSLVSEAREIFKSAHIPTFSTPEAAVEAFYFIGQYHSNQKLLKQLPEPSELNSIDPHGARLIIHNALKEKRELLNTLETRAVLRAFEIPVTQAIQANNVNEAIVAAESVGFPVAMKVLSDKITHKSDSGGVILNIADSNRLMEAYEQLVESVNQAVPDANVHSVTIEKMMSLEESRELIIGVSRDPVFGPAISFGSGGTSVEVLKDSSTALPPLNQFIAERMISKTKINKLLGAFRGRTAVDRNKLVNILLRISEMVCEIPEIIELDLNPVLANDKVSIAVDARIRIQKTAPGAPAYSHMAIHPFPSYLEKTITTNSGLNVNIRPIKAEDAQMETEFVNSLSEQTKYLRFMQNVQKLSEEMLVKFTQIDYDQEMAFIAYSCDHHRPVEIGVTRYSTNPDGVSCEFALVVRDDFQHQGIGSHLLESLIDHARQKGLKTMNGEVLKQNKGMLSLAKLHGFVIQTCEEDPQIMLVSKSL